MPSSIILRGEPQREYALNFLRGLKIDPDRPFVVTVEPYRKKRSLSQLALLWVRHAEVSKAVAEHTGMSPEDFHEYAKERWLTPRIVEFQGRVLKRYSTKDLTAGEMKIFMDQIEAWAATDLGIMLANPEDRYQR